MIKDLILVIAGIVIFMIPAIMQKQKVFSKAAVLSGSFVTVARLVILISEIHSPCALVSLISFSLILRAFLHEFLGI